MRENKENVSCLLFAPNFGKACVAELNRELLISYYGLLWVIKQRVLVGIDC